VLSILFFLSLLPLSGTLPSFAGIGYALRPAALGPGFARSARIVAIAFVGAGIAAVFSPVGRILGIVMSGVQVIWILVAAVALAASTRRATKIVPALS
jgi:hypothetical protein